MDVNRRASPCIRTWMCASFVSVWGKDLWATMITSLSHDLACDNAGSSKGGVRGGSEGKGGDAWSHFRSGGCGGGEGKIHLYAQVDSRGLTRQLDAASGDMDLAAQIQSRHAGDGERAHELLEGLKAELRDSQAAQASAREEIRAMDEVR